MGLKIARVPQPRVASTIDDVRAEVSRARSARKRIGVVPTMGALHEGHLSLLRAARATCDFTVATIFVNPTQFAPGEDFEKYPRPLERDLELCEAAGAQLIYTPSKEMMYPPGHQTIVEVQELSLPWEGACRPIHFRGVTTVVLKLFNIVQPDVAFFGQKDYQQQLLIRRMCRDLDVPVRIETCPTIREPDGLAMSSRNAYLSPAERARSLRLSQALFLAAERVGSGETDLAAVRAAMQAHLEEDPEIAIEYATIVDAWTLQELEQPQNAMVAVIAARVGATRLIDNLLLPPFDLARLNAGAP